MKFKLHWGHAPILLLGGFILFILTLIFSAGDMGTLITENSYQSGLSYQKEIDAQERYNKLKEKPTIKNQANGILITFPKTINPTNGKIILKAYANEKSDLMLDLELGRNQTFLIPANRLKANEYQFQLFFSEHNQTYLFQNKSLKWTTP